MKKWLIPIAYPFVTALAVLLSGAVGSLENGHDTGYGGIVIVLVGLIFYCVIVIPTMCILYSRYCLSGQKLRFLFTLYQSFFIGLPCLIPCFMGRDIVYIAYSIILFVWGEIWGLIGLLILKHKTKKQNL